jgi:hypothetical protein
MGRGRSASSSRNIINIPCVGAMFQDARRARPLAQKSTEPRPVDRRIVRRHASASVPFCPDPRALDVAKTAPVGEVGDIIIRGEGSIYAG